jgi:hypothetical protein
LATETALAQLLAADLSGLDLVALMVDGVHFGEHTCVVALGIDIDGVKHPFSLVEGSTENTTLVTDLIVGLREHGLDVTKPILAVLAGSKALRRAVLDVFDRPVIGRCQLHKIGNVEDRLPDKLRAVVAARMRRAYRRATSSATTPATAATPTPGPPTSTNAPAGTTTPTPYASWPAPGSTSSGPAGPPTAPTTPINTALQRILNQDQPAAA